jgi:hypothetical protein
MASQVFTLSQANLQVIHDSSNRVIDMTVGPNRLHDRIAASLQTSRFGLTFQLDPQISQICQDVFDFADWIYTAQNNASLAAGVTDYLFNGFTLASIPLMFAGANVASSSIWLEVCKEVWRWESSHGKKVHKGTPYYFLGGTYILCGNLDAGFLFVHNAIEEDKRLAQTTGNPNGYKRAPAYMFASLIDDPNNFLYDLVREMKHEVENYIGSYVNTIRGTFDFQTFNTKFLENEELEEEKFMFVYNLETLIQQKKLSRAELVNNEFSRLRNLDIIFNLCLLVDKVLQQRFGKEYISQNIVELCRTEGWISQNDLENLRTQIDFNNQPDTIIPKLLPLNLTYNSQPLPKELSCMLVAWRLRNYGGHNLKGQSVLVNNYPDIIMVLMYALMIAINKL